ncbi:prepilin peptidase [Enterobacter asburiae]|uniref:prepilin peptidase n=1 Tax=Scandinavium sp. UTDF21-P1B TaxID=3446379 RepID=UPI00346B3686
MLFSIFFALMGAVVGSFINVVIYRLPRMLQGESITLSLPASHCPQCQAPVKIRHNLPVLGWLLLRGRCYQCQQRISPRYPLVELLMAALFVLTITLQGVTPQGILGLLAISLLVPLFFIDLETSLLPDRLTLPLLALVVTAAVCGFGHVTWQEALLAAATGFGLPWLLDRFYCWCRGKAGMGMGDMKLFAGIGGWLGMEALFQIMIIASLLAIVSAWCLLRRKPGETFPFGPYLVLAALAWYFCCY